MNEKSRIVIELNMLQKQNKPAFIPFITAGYPNLTTTEKLIYMFDELGCSVVELGVPFSDPMADGPVIEKASEEAIKNGVTLNKILDLVKKVRKKTNIPILLMGYYNSFYKMGLEKFAKKANESGVDGVLIVDLPPEEGNEFRMALKNKSIDMIYLLTPTSDEARIKLVKKYASGFVYYVSYTGITGAKGFDVREIEKNIKKIKKHIKIPVNVGFGVSKPEHVKALNKVADGVVVGSAIIKMLGEGKSLGDVKKYLTSLSFPRRRESSI